MGNSTSGFNDLPSLVKGGLARLGAPIVLGLLACTGSSVVPIQAGGREFLVKEAEAHRALKLDKTARVDQRRVCEVFDVTLSDDAERQKVSEQFAAWMEARSKMLCPDRNVAGHKGAAQCGPPFPKPKRRYLAVDALAILPEAQGIDWADSNDFNDSLDESRGGRVSELPANTAVDFTGVLRDSRTAQKDDACVFAAITVVDAGGAVQAGRRYVVPLSSLSEASVGEPPGVALRREAEERRQATARAFKDEAETGRCSTEHVDYLRKVLSGTKQLFDGMRSGSYPQLFDAIGHEMLVASDEGAPATFKAVVGGEIHLFSFQFSQDLRMDVLDGAGYPVTQDSSYGPLLMRTLRIGGQSRILQANAGEKITVNVKGRGCTLVVAMTRL